MTGQVDASALALELGLKACVEPFGEMFSDKYPRGLTTSSHRDFWNPYEIIDCIASVAQP